MRSANSSAVYAFLKTAHDAHTIGIQSAASLLQDCGYEVVRADGQIELALSHITDERARKEIIDWISHNEISKIGITYRLDKSDAVRIFGYFVEELKKNQMLSTQGGPIDALFFGGLPESCKAIKKEFADLVSCFQGGESARETLLAMGVPSERIPVEMLEVSQYDDVRESFAKEIIDKGEYNYLESPATYAYPGFGSRQDTVLKRLQAVRAGELGKRPLVRAHVGPYSSDQKRSEAIKECANWSQQLAASGFLDILSLGTSQLTQSNFGENWHGKINGGGVPINSPDEFIQIYEAGRPLLMRTYAGTKNISELAQMYEETINISWHAMSLWWFNLLDGRGPYDLYTSLKEQILAIRYVAATGKPFEANVSHHFSFRGADDVTYIVSAYLAAKLLKKLGIKTFVLQNMLNTPGSTWGVQDLAKSRAMLTLVRSLEDENFKVLLQPRAGLEYFVADPYKAKIQLAAVSCLMDDIEAHNDSSPELLHVVSYSEASHLATPDVIDESIKITLHTLKEYRRAKRRGLIDDMNKNEEATGRERKLYQSSKKLIDFLEKSYPDLYSAEGFYKIFAAGFLPTPYLWKETEEFVHAVNWRSKSLHGSQVLINDLEDEMSTDERLELAGANIRDAEFLLKRRS
ncbi:MAG: cobalamin-binding protein [Eubacteriales bacterium]|nr:cobalamin-binding protein [Eubacteriales bacterium]MDD4541124.1 cobalamin-binding protein [Eubacteriales bacterium]